MDGFVAGNEDERFAAVSLGGFEYGEQAEDIVADGFACVFLHQSEVFAGSSVINHLRALGAAEAGDFIGNRNVCDAEASRVRRAKFFEFAMQIEHAGLIAVGAEKLFRMASEKLSAEFRTDRAGSAGDEHGLVADMRSD